VSIFASKATKLDASTLVSLVVNVISSETFTFVIAANVSSTVPVVIVAFRTPLIAAANKSVLVAEIFEL